LSLPKLSKLDGDESGSVLRSSPRIKGVSGDCVTLSVDGYEICLYATNLIREHGVIKPGYILYTLAPANDFRKKIRDCLSFSLGTYLAHLGHTTLCEDGSLSSFEAVNGY
jgi:hypothetical protein